MSPSPTRAIGSLRARLLVAALLWIIVAIPLGGVALALSFRAVLADDFDARLQTLLLNLIGSTEVTRDGEVTVARGLGDARFEQVYSGWYWIVAPPGETSLRSRSLWDLPFIPTARPASATPQLRTIVDASGIEVRVIEQTVRLPGLSRPVAFAVTGNLAQLNEEVGDFDQLLWLSLSALGVGLLIAIVTQVSIGLRPLQRVAREVERIRARKQSHLNATGLAEIDLLVDQVNSLIEHDRVQLERFRGHAADLAHSLKTPLAVLRSSFGGAEHDEQRAQLDAVQRLIDRQLARAASAGPRPGAAVDVDRALHVLFEGMRRIHASRGLDLSYECPPAVRFAGDAEDFEEMLGNVLDNACKWARAQVAASASIVGDRLVIAIDDDGSGMTEMQAHCATERGQRFDRQVPGTGLGLAIVRDLIDTYAGDLELTHSPLGGTRVTLTLPAARDP